ncbi:unnamed protein product [Ambrosiozyma monospora]|uniref:MICOS complex subunit n=1 Tax=Ambrosiozyma monospora TaxID=43982 RepID=A0A9W6WLB7_AMBMO|nr:unnamed protein product [Ambrosiozyma monospora]
MASRLTKLGLTFLGSSALYFNSQATIKNDSKRNFYQDNTQDSVPGEPTKVEELQLPKLIKQEKETTSFLQEKVKGARIQLSHYLEESKKLYLNGSNKYFEAERKVTGTLSSLHDKREELFPNSLYVLTGLLSGLVLSRRKNILARVTFPLFTGLIAFKVFLPSTFANTFSWLDGVEQAKLPSVYSTQTALIKGTESLVKETENLTAANAKKVNEYYESAKLTVNEYTGLNVDQEISNKKK